MKISSYKSTDKQAWDAYVVNHSDATHCHLSGWRNVIAKTYGHRTYYLIAEEASKIVGLLPLVHVKSFLFGNQLVSMPFLTYGGILADSPEVAGALMQEAMQLCSILKASRIELRHVNPLDHLHLENANTFFQKTHKVRMVLELPDSPEALFKSFKSKLRSQIHRPQKEGMNAVIGGSELLDDFYRVFSNHMRDLGSPVHSKKLFRQIFSHFDQNVKIGVIQFHCKPVAVGLIFCFRDTVEIPWASSLRKYNRFSTNMFLYWSLLKHACDQGFRYFDFGRSTPGRGTYKFKEQWGATPYPLSWYIGDHSENKNVYSSMESTTMVRAMALWQRLPLFVANRVGPMIRGSISL